ncbi:MAG: cryptochrome/photolyase family protein [Bradymonadales bacterium]|nr:MAG: cryptochrome/photolyase family protein [Bradymonadales bacterium]
MSRSLLLILGSQLFPRSKWAHKKPDFIFMAEDEELCRRYRFHKQKIFFFLAAMRQYAREFPPKEKNKLIYFDLDHPLFSRPYEEKLLKVCREKKIDKLYAFEVEDKFFERFLISFCRKNEIKVEWIQSPQFIFSRAFFKDYLSAAKRPLMKSFYEAARRETGILMTKGGKPKGGKFSYDQENRKKLPKTVKIPERPEAQLTANEMDLLKKVRSQFSDHPGETDDYVWVHSRESALFLLDEFVRHRLIRFGDFQDSITSRSDFVFHSALSPYLNCGLLLPEDLLAAVSKSDQKLPLNSVEGFVRQVLGWREFVRGIYQCFSEGQEKKNFWNHHGSLNGKWYEARTGLLPVDDAIRKALKFSYNHHIERLMIISNLMLLCRIHPKEVHRWFMEMYIDSSDWVMGPNVYGMGQFSDGGIFATKPYISGSNYILKMSDYKRADWCDLWDALYWSFVGDNLNYFQSQYRMSMMAKMWMRIESKRKDRLKKMSEEFIAGLSRD